MNEKLSQALKTIERANNTFCYSVWVPSLNKEVPFKELSTSQQKRILKSLIDSPIYNTEFIRTSYEIINENCSDASVDCTKLSILDKLIILLKLRSVSIGDEVEVEMVSVHDKKLKIKTSFSIEDVLKNIKLKVQHPEPKLVELAPYSITVSLPNILCELELEKEMRGAESNVEISTPEELRKSIGDKFVGELAKFIKTIAVGDESISLAEYSFKDKIDIVETLPARVIERVVEAVNDFTKEIEKVTILKRQTSVSGKDEDFTYTLSIDASFFTSS